MPYKGPKKEIQRKKGIPHEGDSPSSALRTVGPCDKEYGWNLGPEGGPSCQLARKRFLSPLTEGSEIGK